MDGNEIKKILETKEYDFLRTNEHLENNIILLTTGGSHSYGTNIEGSDLDIRGIAIENINDILGLSSFEQFIDEATDTTIYGLRKVLSLMLNCNPNVIEMLGTKDDQIFICNDYGTILKNNVNLFLTRKAINSFGGYATAQLRRLQNALARDSYHQQEKEKHILSNINNQLLTIEDRYRKLENGSLNLYVDKSSKDDMETEIFMDINLKGYPLRDFKNIYNEMSTTVKEYSKIGQRNNKKDDYHLNKHAMHLIRLLKMGTEILEGKGINTYRSDDIPFMMDIRNGKYSFEEIFRIVDDCEKEFKYAAENTGLPSKPDYHAVEEMLVNIYRAVIREYEHSVY